MIEIYYAEDDDVIGKSVKEYLDQHNCLQLFFPLIHTLVCPMEKLLPDQEDNRIGME